MYKKLLLIIPVLLLSGCNDNTDSYAGYRKMLAKDFRSVCLGQMQQRYINAGHDYANASIEFKEGIATFCNCMGNQVAKSLPNKLVKKTQEYELKTDNLPITYLWPMPEFKQIWDKSFVACNPTHNN
ncbi:hypothetical protein LJC18_04440 [Lachnospiraceae bacterium OttesenSCG-928-E19]|nr:hypothetical protein [Lachnospiraceae bacterium OttesenSCG-928-E19]